MSKKIFYTIFIFVFILIFACGCNNSNLTDSQPQLPYQEHPYFVIEGDTITKLTTEGRQQLSLSIPESFNGITLTTIKRNAFSSIIASFLKIPKTITKIESGAISGYNLTIKCELNSAPKEYASGWNCFFDMNSNYRACPIIWNCLNNNIADNNHIYILDNEILYAINTLSSLPYATVKYVYSYKTKQTIPNYFTYETAQFEVANIEKDVFRYPQIITELTIPFVGAQKDGINNVKLNYIIEKSVAKQLKKITITNAVSIGKNAFYDWQNLEVIELPQTLQSIASWSFYNCINLKTLIIPKSVINIDRYPFNGCNKLSIFCEDIELKQTWNSLWDYNIENIYWYSEETPLDNSLDGKYWKYENNQIKIWE